MEHVHCIPTIDQHKSPGHMALIRSLNRTFKKIMIFAPKLDNSENLSHKSLASLTNLLEQRNVLESGITDSFADDVAVVPLFSDFPDAQSRLMVKLSEEIDKKVQLLLETCSSLQELHDMTMKGVTEATSLLQRYRADLDLERLNAGEATVPPLSVMLGWLMAMERESREQNCSRQYILQGTMDDGHPVTADNLERLWSQDFDKLKAVLNDCKEQCKYFIEQSV